jgi:hypothetical protein
MTPEAKSILKTLTVLQKNVGQTMNGFPPSRSQTAHDKMRQKAFIAKSQKELDSVATDIVTHLPKTWPQKWTFKLSQTGKNVSFTSGSAKNKIGFKFEFNSQTVAKFLGTLLGKSEQSCKEDPQELKDLAHSLGFLPSDTKTYFLPNTYSEKLSLKGRSVYDAIILYKLKDVAQIETYTPSWQQQKSQQEEYKSAYDREQFTLDLEKTVVSLLPILWNKVFNHSFFHNSKVDTHCIPQINGVKEFQDTFLTHHVNFKTNPILNTIFENENRLGMNDISLRGKQRTLLKTLTLFLKILETSRPRTGPVTEWIILNDKTQKFTKVLAWDGKTSLILDTLNRLLAGEFDVEIYDKSSVKYENVFTGNFLDLKEE